MSWLIACLTLLVVGELLIGRLGLALILRMAPARFVGVVVGGWYDSGALGYWLAGEIGALWIKWSQMGGLALLALLPLVGTVVVWQRPQRVMAK